MDLGAFQQLMESTYGANDRERGVPATVAWLAEEVGELAQAVRKGTRAEQEHEFADVLAWLASLANQVGIDLDDGRRRATPTAARVRGDPLHVSLKQRFGPDPGRTGDQDPDQDGSSMSSSAICTALRAAPLRRLSLLTNRARPRPSSTPSSWRMPPDVGTGRCPAACSGVGMSLSSTPGAAASSSVARSTESGRANSALIDSEWPVNTGTRTHVPDTARSGMAEDLAALVAELLLLVGLERGRRRRACRRTAAR